MEISLFQICIKDISFSYNIEIFDWSLPHQANNRFRGREVKGSSIGIAGEDVFRLARPIG